MTISTTINSTSVSDTVQSVIQDPQLANPPMYALIMHNDDYTAMDFVVSVLTSELALPVEQAYHLMLLIHHQGYAKVAVLPKEIAQMKANKIHQLAEAADYPLLVTLEAC